MQSHLLTVTALRQWPSAPSSTIMKVSSLADRTQQSPVELQRLAPRCSNVLGTVDRKVMLTTPKCVVPFQPALNVRSNVASRNVSPFSTKIDRLQRVEVDNPTLSAALIGDLRAAWKAGVTLRCVQSRRLGQGGKLVPAGTRRGTLLRKCR